MNNRSCWWCGRDEWIGTITDDNGDTFAYCHRHEAEVRSMIEDPEPVETD